MLNFFIQSGIWIGHISGRESKSSFGVKHLVGGVDESHFVGENAAEKSVLVECRGEKNSADDGSDTVAQFRAVHQYEIVDHCVGEAHFRKYAHCFCIRGSCSLFTIQGRRYIEKAKNWSHYQEHEEDGGVGS